jgi:hypothetical protein
LEVEEENSGSTHTGDNAASVLRKARSRCLSLRLPVTGILVMEEADRRYALQVSIRAACSIVQLVIKSKLVISSTYDNRSVKTGHPVRNSPISSSLKSYRIPVCCGSASERCSHGQYSV